MRAPHWRVMINAVDWGFEYVETLDQAIAFVGLGAVDDAEFVRAAFDVL
jgi:hypothetical protein